MNRTIRTLALGALASLLCFHPASAQLSYGQYFTSPGTNTFLQSIHTGMIWSDGVGVDYTFELFQVTPGLPYLTLTGPALFVKALTGPVSPNQTVPVNLLLAPLQTYAFLLRTTADPPEMWMMTNSDAIPDGMGVGCGGYHYQPEECYTVGADVDGFSATFIATPVPEPSTILLLGTGLFGVGFMAWRRREEDAG